MRATLTRLRGNAFGNILLMNSRPWRRRTLNTRDNTVVPKIIKWKSEDLFESGMFQSILRAMHTNTFNVYSKLIARMEICLRNVHGKKQLSTTLRLVSR